MMADRDRASLDRRERPWPVVVHPLHEHGAEEEPTSMTAEQRFEQVWILSARMWELTGRPLPTYTRSEMPIRIQQRV